MVLTHQHAVASVILVLSFAAAALLGFADVRAEQAAAAREVRWPAEKILPLSPAAKLAGAASITRNISPHIRGRRSRS